MASFGFSANQYEPDAGGFGEPIAEGWYKMSADEGEISPTKDNASTGGMYAKFRFVVEEGAMKGRKVFKNFNIVNANEEAQNIGRRQLSALAVACGRPDASATEQLLGIPFWAKVKIKKGGAKDPSDPNGEKYPDQNEIGTFKHISETPTDTKAGASSAPKNPFAKPPSAETSAPPATAPAAAAPTAPKPPTTPVAPPAAPAFPPEGWTPHPDSPGWFYKGQEVLSEQQLREKFAAPSAPAVPVAPPATPTAPAEASAAQSAVPPWART